MVPTRHRILIGAVVLCGIALPACGISDPYAGHPRPRTATRTGTATQNSSAPATTDADPASERAGTIPTSARAAQHAIAAGAAEPTPEAAVDRYARVYINWTARTVAHVQRQLAAISVDGARAQALAAAARYQRDTTLAASQIANSGTVESVAAGHGPASGEWVVVTRERTTGQGDYSGLPNALHIIYARAVRHGSGWVISEWSPQT